MTGHWKSGATNIHIQKSIRVVQNTPPTTENDWLSIELPHPPTNPNLVYVGLDGDTHIWTHTDDAAKWIDQHTDQPIIKDESELR